MGSNIIYQFMPPANTYLGSRELMVGEEMPLYATSIPPLPQRDYFISKWDEDKQHWVYVEAPLRPNMRENPLDKVLTYADCRRMEYPKIEDYVDGVVKGDVEQIRKYMDECVAVKERWPKDMEPMTLREYYQQSM